METGINYYSIMTMLFFIMHKTGPGERTWLVAVQNLIFTRFKPATHTCYSMIRPSMDPFTGNM